MTTEYIRCTCGADAEYHDSTAQVQFEVDGKEHKPHISIPAPLCARCLATFVAENVEPIVRLEAEEAARARNGYIERFEEAFKRGVCPVVCSSCREYVLRWIKASIDGGPYRDWCAQCYYTATRDALLLRASEIENPDNRQRAVLRAMPAAKRSRDEAFAVWDEYDSKPLDPELLRTSRRAYYEDVKDIEGPR